MSIRYLFLIDKFDVFSKRNIEVTGLFKKDSSKVINLKECITPNKTIISKKIPSNI